MQCFQNTILIGAYWKPDREQHYYVNNFYFIMVELLIDSMKMEQKCLSRNPFVLLGSDRGGRISHFQSASDLAVPLHSESISSNKCLKISCNSSKRQNYKTMKSLISLNYPKQSKHSHSWLCLLLRCLQRGFALFNTCHFHDFQTQLLLLFLYFTVALKYIQ